MKKIIFAGALIMLVMASFFFRLQIIETAALQAAKYLGVQIDAIEVSQISVDRLVIARLNMSYQNAALRLDTQISALSIDFDWRSSEKYRLRAITIERMSATVKASEANTANTANTANAVNDSGSNASINDWLAYAPLMAASINHFDISYLTDQARLFQFTGAVRKDSAFNLTGVVNADRFPGADIDFKLTGSDFDLAVNTRHSKQTVLAWRGKYFIDNKWLSVQWRGLLGLSAVNHYLTVLSVPEYIQHDVSHIDAELELDLTRATAQLWHSLAMRADLESSAAINVNHPNVSRLKLHIQSRCVLQALSQLRCVLEQPQSAGLALRHASAWLTDYLPGAETEFVLELNPQDQIVIDYSYHGQGPGRVQAQGNFNAYLRAASSGLRLEASLSRIQFVTDFAEWQFRGGYQTRLDIKAPKPPWPAAWLLFSAQGEVRAAQNQITVASGQGLRLIMRDIKAAHYSLDKLELTQTQDVTVHYRLPDGQFSGARLPFELASHNFTYDEAKLTHAPWQIELTTLLCGRAFCNITAQLKNKNISFERAGLTLSGVDLFSTVEVKNNILNATGKLLPAQQGNTVEFRLQQNFSSQRGFAQLQADDIRLSENKLIAQQISQTGLPLQLSDGTAQLRLHAGWGEAPQMEAALSVTAASGDYAQNRFSNLTASLAFVNQQGWKLITPATIAMESFNMGLPLTDISIDLQALEYQRPAQPLIEIGRFSAAVLDGSMYGQNINVDLNQTENRFSIYLSGLSLEELLALNQTQGLAVSGYFDGELPVMVNSQQLLIENGWLKADKNGGFIKYANRQQVLPNNQSLRLVGELLEDFQYSEMSAQVDLNAQGNLFLVTKLHGHSPGAAINTPINLNFNVEFNLWKFLDSARVLTRMDQDISQQVISKP